ncbi:hypothetical protein FSP39_023063 [Pinctada imbricata]|uniref:Uncharacterized protein n=1 Tax=Pinctada imbricata TaxID=66713 RepID=A0AA88YWA6_PINIB|nr:hypothetical protein FSP39_023063 [Pinctada imbricata]
MRSHITSKGGGNSEIGEHCVIIKPLIKYAITPTVKESLATLMQKNFGEIKMSEFFKALKIQRNSFVFYSSSCGKVKQKNSYTLLLERQTLGCDVIQVDYYIKSFDLRRTFAVGC